MLTHPTATNTPQDDADVNAAVVQTGRSGSRSFSVMECNHRKGGRKIAGFADAHCCAGCQELKKASSRSGRPGDSRPESQARDEHGTRSPSVGNPTCYGARQSIDPKESRAQKT
jgi:hypothetical protein